MTTTPPDSRTAEERAETECPRDLNFRKECDWDTMKCGAKVSWKEGYLAGFRARDELLDQFRVQIAQSILVMEAAIKERDTLKAELADLRNRGEVMREALEKIGKYAIAGVMRVECGQANGLDATVLDNIVLAAPADSQKGEK